MEGRQGLLAATLIYFFVFLMKGGGYFATKYLSMLAEATHTFVDVLISISMLFIFTAARKPPDQEHPYGHHRFEALLALVMSIVFISFVGFSLFKAGFLKLWKHELSVPGSPALALIILGLAFLLNFWPMALLKKEKSLISKTMFLEMVNDQLDTFAAFLGVGGAALGYPFFDPLGAIAISFFIFRSGFILFRQSAKILVGTAPPESIYQEIIQVATSVKGVKGVHDAMAEYIGPDLIRADLHITVDKDLPVWQAEKIMNQVNVALREKLPYIRFSTVDVCPHFGHPTATADSVLENMKDQLSSLQEK